MVDGFQDMAKALLVFSGALKPRSLKLLREIADGHLGKGFTVAVFLDAI